MNIQKGELCVENGNVYVHVFETKLLLPKEKFEKLEQYHGQKIWFGIRPEDVKISMDKTNRNTIKGLVTLIEKTGSEAYLYFKVENGLFVARLNIEYAQDVKHGDQIEFLLDMSRCHIFEFFTEKNIGL